MESPDDRLAERLADGEPDAFARVYDLHGRDLYGYLLARTRRAQVAEDLLQILMLRLVRARARLREVRDLRAYLFAAARNEWLRLGSGREADAGLLGDPPAPAGDGDPDATEALGAALARLAPERREVVGLKVHHGLTFVQIGEVLAIPPDTAASRYRRALEDLRRLMERNDVDVRP